MGLLLDQMLKRDSADLDMQQTVQMYRHMVATLPPQVFTLLPPDWARDARRLERAGHLTLPPNFPHA